MHLFFLVIHHRTIFHFCDADIARSTVMLQYHNNILTRPHVSEKKKLNKNFYQQVILNIWFGK
jgi:hypothetical protein